MKYLCNQNKHAYIPSSFQLPDKILNQSGKVTKLLDNCFFFYQGYGHEIWIYTLHGQCIFFLIESDDDLHSY